MNTACIGVEDLLIRHCQSHQELETCVQLQREIWKFQDEDLTPAAILAVAQRTGGHVLYAVDGAAPIGFALAFSAEHSTGRYWHSHMAGVIPAYQNRGVGTLLKLRQREEALQKGLVRMEWTFDPLELRNAYFNINKLGAIARKYIPNCYGRRVGAMDNGLPTDRLLCEWRLDSARVAAVLSGSAMTGHDETVEISIPADVSRLKQTDAGSVRAIQERLGAQLTDLFHQDYAVTGFERGGETCRYLLERYEA